MSIPFPIFILFFIIFDLSSPFLRFIWWMSCHFLHYSFHLFIYQFSFSFLIQFHFFSSLNFSLFLPCFFSFSFSVLSSCVHSYFFSFILFLFHLWYCCYPLLSWQHWYSFIAYANQIIPKIRNVICIEYIPRIIFSSQFLIYNFFFYIIATELECF